MSRRIVILGASGQVGSVLFRKLGKAFPDAEVTGCFRHSTVAAPLTTNAQGLRFDPFRDDWSILGKADVLINSIGVISETKAMSFEKVHQGLTDRMLENRPRLGNPKLIQLSVLGADADSVSGFLRTKALADAKLLTQSRTVVIRPSIVCTPGTVMVRKLRMLGKIGRGLRGYLPFPAGFANTRIQPVMADDVAELVSELCRHDQHPKLIEAAGPAPFSLRQLIGYLGVDRRRIRLLPVPQPLFDALFKLSGLLLPGLLNGEQFQLLKRDNVAGVTDFQRLLGRLPADTENFWIRELR